MQTSWKYRAAAPLALALLATPGIAHAEPGDHVAVGNATVIPGVDVGTEYRSNVYRLQNNTIGAAAFLVTPHITVENNNSDFMFNLSAGLSARHYYYSGKSDNPFYNRANLNRYNDTDATANLYLMPGKLVGFKIREDFSNDNLNTESVWAERAYISHLVSDTSVAVTLAPGSALFADLGGHLEADVYRGNPGASFVNQVRLNSRTAYGPKMYAKWTFFPRTALEIDGSVDWFNWSNNLLNSVSAANRLVPEDQDIGQRLAVPDGREARISAGLIGRVNNKVVVNLSAGYGAINFDDQSVLDAADALGAAEGADEVDVSEGWGQDLAGVDGILGVAQVTVAPVQNHALSLGYKKDFEDSWFTNYLAYHYVFGRYTGTVASRWTIGLEGGYRFENYVGEVERADHYVRTGGTVSYNATEWLDITGGFGWKRRASWANHPNGPLPSIEYDDFPVSLVFQLTY